MAVLELRKRRKRLSQQITSAIELLDGVTENGTGIAQFTVPTHAFARHHSARPQRGQVLKRVNYTIIVFACLWALKVQTCAFTALPTGQTHMLRVTLVLVLLPQLSIGDVVVDGLEVPEAEQGAPNQAWIQTRSNREISRYNE